MVGTAYRKPSPDAKNFVEIGSRVEAGDRLLLVEAMKTFNDIVAPRAGKVVAFMRGQTRAMWDFEDVGDWWTRFIDASTPEGLERIVVVTMDRPDRRNAVDLEMLLQLQRAQQTAREDGARVLVIGDISERCRERISDFGMVTCCVVPGTCSVTDVASSL